MFLCSGPLPNALRTPHCPRSMAPPARNRSTMNSNGQLVSQLRDRALHEEQILVRGLRAVHRAMAELRRGTPVLLRGPEGALVLAAAEVVSARGLAELAEAARGPSVLLLAPVRAAAVLQRPVPQGPTAAEPAAVALRLPAGLLDPAALKSLADPTAERLLPA